MFRNSNTFTVLPKIVQIGISTRGLARQALSSLAPGRTWKRRNVQHTSDSMHADMHSLGAFTLQLSKQSNLLPHPVHNLSKCQWQFCINLWRACLLGIKRPCTIAPECEVCVVPILGRTCISHFGAPIHNMQEISCAVFYQQIECSSLKSWYSFSKPWQKQ